MIGDLNDYYSMLNYLCTRLTDLHWFYSPRFFLGSSVDLSALNELDKSCLDPIIVLDRNIFSRLIKVITEGKTEQGSTQDIAILITLCGMKNYNILPFFALNELASGQGREDVAQKEYYAFKRLFSDISLLNWMALAIGGEKENKQLIKLHDNEDYETKFNKNTIDYLINYAAMLHFAYVWRTENDNLKRFTSFFEWYYNNSKVSRFMVTYICSVLSSREGYKAPKRINNNSFEKIVEGCQNQARDISYLTALSVDRIPYDRYEIILASDDGMLGRVFTEGCFNIDAIRLFEKNIKKGQKQVSGWVDNLLRNHIEVVTSDNMEYYKMLVKNEYDRLKMLF